MGKKGEKECHEYPVNCGYSKYVVKLGNRKIAKEQRAAHCMKNDIGLSDMSLSHMCQGRRGEMYLFLLLPLK